MQTERQENHDASSLKIMTYGHRCTAFQMTSAPNDRKALAQTSSAPCASPDRASDLACLGWPVADGEEPGVDAASEQGEEEPAQEVQGTVLCTGNERYCSSC